ncbi:MAG: type III-A CRISPR-associated protein Csm2 [Lachnospiraceae bacterium]|nr:type III-A CRISPR-associated protein Csm2 [Lachnospiraceae bacterium]
MKGNEQGYTGQRRPGGSNNRGFNPGSRDFNEKKKERVITVENYVEEAEDVIREIRQERDREKELTTTKLRNLLALSSDIYNMVVHQNSDKLTEEIKSRIEYLRVRFLYEAGRDEGVRGLVENANLLGVLKNIKGSKKNYILFNRYMEALVAFHRYLGGKD